MCQRLLHQAKLVSEKEGPGPIVALRRVSDSAHTFRKKENYPDSWVIWTKISLQIPFGEGLDSDLYLFHYSCHKNFGSARLKLRSPVVFLSEL